MGLAVPTPASEVPGNFITSALWNASVYSPLTFLLNPPTFVGYQSTSQSLSNSSWTPLNIDTVANDPYGGHSSTSNTSRYTCQPGAGGWYTACGVYAPNGNGNGFRAVKLQVNGTAVLGAAAYLPAMGPEMGLVTPVKDIFLKPGDYIEVCGWQSSGGALGTALDSDLRTGLWVRFSHV
ncbi:hypothetical protein [Kitasatospora sp. NPDC085464]|uniref:hypothetical protein n=1 Tax=Kitasatospora sp. NPDC085464 TaxID=3364063 RepID=UPI0037C62C64